MDSKRQDNTQHMNVSENNNYYLRTHENFNEFVDNLIKYITELYEMSWGRHDHYRPIYRNHIESDPTQLYVTRMATIGGWLGQA